MGEPSKEKYWHMRKIKKCDRMIANLQIKRDYHLEKINELMKGDEN